MEIKEYEGRQRYKSGDQVPAGTYFQTGLPYSVGGPHKETFYADPAWRPLERENAFFDINGHRIDREQVGRDFRYYPNLLGTSRGEIVGYVRVEPADRDWSVYFGCSMRGGYGLVTLEELRKMQLSIEDILGMRLASTHQTHPDVVSTENKLKPVEIHDRDWGFIEESGICVFEISNPSLGVGSEISDADRMGKPVLCLWSDKVDPATISGYVAGKEGSKHANDSFRVKSYHSLGAALGFIQDFAKLHVKED